MPDNRQVIERAENVGEDGKDRESCADSWQPRLSITRCGVRIDRDNERLEERFVGRYNEKNAEMHGPLQRGGRVRRWELTWARAKYGHS